eukprot:TRINITY_DN2195_c0_g1_i1.p1 TRINITY_DN2195_c0_g1~~TRINITY_DN2195_c0_g1_i1.p1  ORF type:complete len:757 (+),score=172.62 TRINITY_DN2195_c0_g1_i1:268-2271(+)
MHEVHDKTEGAFMDSMELERERGITIQSAATHCSWKDCHINLIDTPGHVDFTIEVERSLRVLDGAVMVLCGVAGVQSQTLTVDKQMKRYTVPRLCFINKLDRLGANPWKAITEMQQALKLNCAAVQIPVGIEDKFTGVVDLVRRKMLTFDGFKGTKIIEAEVPDKLKPLMEEKRTLLIEKVADVDEELGDLFLNEKQPTEEQLKAAIRRATIAMKFSPVFMGSAYKNKAVQPLLDGVCDYLPNPTEVKNYALDQSQNEKKVELVSTSDKPLVALAFKLEERPFGQLTYLRVYQGLVKKRDTIVDVATGKRYRTPRVIRMHSNQMEDVDEVGAGEICAMFGVDCNSGTTFTDGSLRYTMSSMFVPEPVIRLAIRPKVQTDGTAFNKALSRFTREDPTFRVSFDSESQQTIIEGMGELHLDIYCERIRREYKVPTITGQPRVNYRETICRRANFDYLHKKQTGGSGQYGRVIGYIEPVESGSKTKFEFVNKLMGNDVPPEFHSAIERGFQEAIERGDLVGAPVEGVRVVLTDGASHPVDSNELAFRSAAIGAFRAAFKVADPAVLEPIMLVEISVPQEFQGVAIAGVNQRQGLIQNTETREDGTIVVVAHVPLSKMFGYSTDIRSCTEGKGEYSMEYLSHQPVPKSTQMELMKSYQSSRQAEIETKKKN